MEVKINIYPTKTNTLEVSLKGAKQLLDDGIIVEGTDGLCFLCKPFKLSITDLGADALNVFLDEQWLPLFPTAKIQATNISPYYVSGNKVNCSRYLKEFMKRTNNRFDFDCVFIATAAYLQEKKLMGFNGVSKNFNFIRRELESWCIDRERNPSVMFAKAKQYYEFIKRDATRERGKLVSSDGFGRSAILGQSDISDESGCRLAPPVTDGGEEDRHLQPTESIGLKARAIRINPAHKE